MTRILPLDIDARDEEPIPVNGAYALYIWNECLNRGRLIDLVLLDAYKLEDVIKAKLNNKSIEPSQEVEALNYVETEDRSRGISCPNPNCDPDFPKPLILLQDAENMLDKKWRCADCDNEFTTRQAWNIH